MKNYLADLGTDFFGGSNPLAQLTGVSGLVSFLTSNLLIIAGVVLVFLIVSSGISMISSSGDPQAFARARVTLTTAIIGFVLVVAAWLIIGIVETATGVTILGTGGAKGGGPKGP